MRRREGYCVQLGFGIPISGAWATPDNQLRLVRRAEELGYHSLWTFQRLLVPEPPDERAAAPAYRSVLDAIVPLAFVAGHTSRIRLGLSVVNLPFFAPATLAKQLTTLDVLSRGRLDVGLGIGWSRQEYAAVGVPYQRRGARAEEFIAALQALWTREVVEFHGDFYQIPRSRVEPKPVQRPHPPLLPGGAALRLPRPAAGSAGRRPGAAAAHRLLRRDPPRPRRSPRAGRDRGLPRHELRPRDRLARHRPRRGAAPRRDRPREAGALGGAAEPARQGTVVVDPREGIAEDQPSDPLALQERALEPRLVRGGRLQPGELLRLEREVEAAEVAAELLGRAGAHDRDHHAAGRLLADPGHGDLGGRPAHRPGDRQDLRRDPVGPLADVGGRVACRPRRRGQVLAREGAALEHAPRGHRQVQRGGHRQVLVLDLAVRQRP